MREQIITKYMSKLILGACLVEIDSLSAIQMSAGYDIENQNNSVFEM